MPLIALIVGVSILLMNEREYLKEGIKMTREEAIELFEKWALVGQKTVGRSD